MGRKERHRGGAERSVVLTGAAVMLERRKTVHRCAKLNSRRSWVQGRALRADSSNEQQERAGRCLAQSSQKACLLPHLHILANGEQVRGILQMEMAASTGTSQSQTGTLTRQSLLIV
jgi:hypothetical protein